MELLMLIVLSLGHLAIDLGSGTVLYSLGYLFMAGTGDLIRHAVAYNFLAFGMQPVWGLAIDYTKSARWAAVLGGAMIFSALLMLEWPVTANVIASTGNALFHLGGGIMVWRLYPAKAWPLGVFVGPGALGIALSRTTAANTGFWIPVILAMLLFVTLLIIVIPGIHTKLKSPYLPRVSRQAVVIVLLLSLSTVIRSWEGLSIGFSWKSQAGMATLLMFTVALGKMLGGFAADRLHRVAAPVVALIIAAPLLAWGAGYPASGLIGTLLFQSTMAITLLGLFEQIPKFPGLAFGILCFCLWTGILLKDWIKLPSQGFWHFALILLSCLALLVALNPRKRSVREVDHYTP